MENRSVLQIACLMAHIELIKYLVENKANVNHKDQYQRNILSICISNRTTQSFELIKYLIDCGANVNDCDQNNQNALILAVRNGLQDVTLLLLNSNVDIDCIDNDGLTPIAYAIQMNAVKMVEILLEYDAATSILDREGLSRPTSATIALPSNF
jgi:ankyrin repeat protein